MSTRRLALVLPLALALGLSACSDAGPTWAEPETLSLTIVGDPHRIGPAGEELPQPVTVYVGTTRGNKATPAKDVVVNFIVTEGGGRMYAGVGVTDDNGLASDYWTLGPEPGANKLEVRMVSGDGTKTVHGTFTATGTGLVAHFPFDGDARDATGNGHDGTVHGAVLTADRFGESNRAYWFDGEQSYIESDVINFPGAFSVALWVRPESHDDGKVWGALVGKYTVPNWEMNINRDTERVVLHTSSDMGAISADPVAAGRWYHLAATYDGEGVGKVYVDGVLVATQGGLGDPPVTDAAVRIGRSAWGGNPLLGVLDDIRIYNYVLSAEEVADLSGDRPAASLSGTLLVVSGSCCSGNIYSIIRVGGTPANPAVHAESVLFSGGHGGNLSNRASRVVSANPPYGEKIIRRDAPSWEPVVIFEGGFRNYSPRLSQDGSRMTWFREGNAGGVYREIWVADSDGSGALQLTSDGVADQEPDISPNNERIAWSVKEGDGGPYDIWIMNADGSSRTKLTSSGSDGSPSFSPDGGRIAFFSARSGVPALYVMDANGGNVREIQGTAGLIAAILPAAEHRPLWSGDGNLLLFNGNSGGTTGIYLVPVDGSSAPKRLRESQVHEGVYDWRQQ